MRWPSEWSEGFPGWHLECSAMSTKYLGETIDIHGGGMDLLFPHHECEIAQNVTAYGKEGVKYWMHNNMITIKGQKMGRSLGNFITLDQLFNGEHDLLQQAFHPMTVKFFILQAHYRNTLDFSNDALAASEKGLQRIQDAMSLLKKIEPAPNGVVNASELEAKCEAAMNDDLNTPALISYLFDGVRTINSIYEKRIAIDQENLAMLLEIYSVYIHDVLGITFTEEKEEYESMAPELIESILDIRQAAKERKEWNTADEIRDALHKLGISIKDRKDGVDWEITD